MEQSRGERKAYKEQVPTRPCQKHSPVVKVLYFNLSILCCAPFDQKEVIVSIRRKHINVL